MQAGLLRSRVDIEQFTSSQTASRAEVKEWTALYSNVPCRIETQGGSEPVAGKEQIAEQRHLVTMRYIPYVTQKNRINWGGRLLDILSVSNVDQRGRTLEITCKETPRSPGN